MLKDARIAMMRARVDLRRRREQRRRESGEGENSVNDLSAFQVNQISLSAYRRGRIVTENGRLQIQGEDGQVVDLGSAMNETSPFEMISPTETEQEEQEFDPGDDFTELRGLNSYERNEAFFVRFQKTRNLAFEDMQDLVPQWIRTEGGDGRVVWTFGKKKDVKRAAQSTDREDEEDEVKGGEGGSSSREVVRPILRSLRSDGEVKFQEFARFLSFFESMVSLCVSFSQGRV